MRAVSPCAKCGVLPQPNDEFCPSCGARLGAGSSAPSPGEALHAEAIRKGRKWILAVAILLAIGTTIMYFMNRSKLDEQIAEAEAQLAGMDPETRDAMMIEEVGMTWEEAVASDRRRLNVGLGVDLALAVAFVGLWWWARKEPFAASLIALLLYLAIIGITGILDPKTLVQGIIIKVICIAALVRAVQAAFALRQQTAGR